MARYFYDKYRANYSSGYYTYSESPWKQIRQFDGGPTASGTGYSSYVFNSNAGTFATAGSSITRGGQLGGGVNEGAIYTGGGSSIRETYYGDYGEIWQVTISEKTVISTYHPGYYYRGSFIETVVGEDGAYPVNGRARDGYWYVKGELANGAVITSTATNINENIIVNVDKNVVDTTTDIELYVTNELEEEVLVRAINDVVGEVILTLTNAEKDILFANSTDKKYIKYRIKATSTLDSDVTIDYSSYGNINFVGVEPTLGIITYRDTNQTSLNVTGNDQIIIQGKSLLQIMFNGLQAKKFATLKTMSIVIGETIRNYIDFTNTNFNFNEVNVDKNTIAEITLTDSRGYIVIETLEILVTPYSNPNIVTLNAFRESGFENDSFLNYNVRFAKVVQGFTGLKFRTKELPSGEWSSWQNVTGSMEKVSEYLNLIDNKFPVGSLTNSRDFEIEFWGIDPFNYVIEIVELEKGRGLAIIDRGGWAWQERIKGVGANGETDYMATISDVTGGYPVGNVSDFNTKGYNGTVELMWTDPTDVIFKDEAGNELIMATWAGTKILRKLGEYPQNENDGVLVVDSGVRNQYSENGFIDTGLTNDVDYYYMAFPYNKGGKITVDIANRVVGTPSDVDDTTGSPGSPNLIAGDMNDGYFGGVSTNELFTGAEISSECGITQGRLQFSDVGWLKFAIDGEIIFKSQKTYRHSISYDHIYSKGCVHGETQVSKNGINYKVTLMKGALTDPSNYSASDRGAHGSEWNRLMLPIHIKAKDKSWAYPAHVENNIPYWGIDFTDTDLQTISSAGSGSYHWCQETPNINATNRVLRGYGGVSDSSYLTSSTTSAFLGWSPVLRVIV